MDLQAVLITIIAFSAVISVLGFVFHLLLSPIKENQIRLEKEMKEGQKKIKEEILFFLSAKKITETIDKNENN